MSQFLIKYLFIASSFILPLLSLANNATLPGPINQPLDSVQSVFQRKISEAKGDSLQQIDAYYEYGQYLSETGGTEASIDVFSTALHIAQHINNHRKVAPIANYLANMYAAAGDFEASNQAYFTALASAEKIKDIGEIAKISMNLASNYNYTGDYTKAIQYGLYALKTKETNNNLERICYHYIAMGNIFRENNNTSKWEEYVKKAYKMKEVEGCASFSDIAKIYNSLGGIYVQKEEFDKALMYYDTLMSLCREAEYNQGISTALTNKAGVYKQLNNFAKALELSNTAEHYFSDNPYEHIFNNNFKAELYNLTGQFSKGLALANKNIKIEEINCYSTEKLKCLELLYELNFNLANYEDAFFWNDSVRQTENMLRDEDIRQSLEELETKYETEKKEQQIELLTTENELKNQRINASIGVVIVLLIVISLIVYILSIRKKQATLLQNDLQQQVLRAQMNPHFIFNVLGSIQNYMMQNDLRKASGFLSKFASLTRATLNNSSAETISLADEISMLTNYIELEKMRNADKFDFEIVTSDELEGDFIQIPPMMVQPFIENAIKHGFKNINHPGFLRLQITDLNESVEFIIEDNGSGFHEKDKAESKHQSMAMKIFEKRRKLIQQKHKKDFKFELLNLEDTNPELSGVKITIHIPILNDN
ncbi:tetratricopeptide repeat-containing sensor histidine kinase [Geofilum sp. OHC36d9]|uniref:tetratricopeptide repeat-containing sensor histidine kinase n=1 Tax=Geofilum sp. OHC36d9 TaxID=3458413 RepID=UPI004033F6A8